MKKPAIGITIGDPAGIGPEVALKAALDRKVRASCRPVLIGPEELWALAGRRLGLEIDGLDLVATHEPAQPPKPGRTSAATGRVAAEAVVAATVLCQQGAIDAMATAPISKQALNASGYHYPGHTELLADLTGARSVAMMFATDRLKVTLATIHQPVRTIASSLSETAVLDKITLTALALKSWWRISKPRIVVLGLNPHAGESGLLGTEDGSVIRPAVARARKLGIDAAGPVSAEDGFRQAMEGRADALVAMYHDQGLLPLKVLGGATNVTLGLPIIRTSPDHGTALDIAGRGRADPGPMVRAVLLAARLAVRSDFNRRHRRPKQPFNFAGFGVGRGRRDNL